MSTNKFAGLEGVDFGAPEVYETNSPSPSSRSRKLPGTRRKGYGISDDDSDYDDDSERDGDDLDERFSRKNRKVGQQGEATSDAGPSNQGDIVRTRLNADEAAKRFRDATGVDARGADFSSALHRRKKRADYYPATATSFETQTYSLAALTGYRTTDADGGESSVRDQDPWLKVSGEKETPIDRYRRLRFEMEELEQEIKRGKSNDAEGDAGAGSNEATPQDAGHGSEELVLQLHALRKHLEGLGEGDALGRASQRRSDLLRQHEEARRLLQGLSAVSLQDSKSSGDAGAQAQHAPLVTSQSSVETNRLSDIDRRLASLELLIGIQDALQGESNALPRPLLPSLARIEHLLTLLTQPRHLDGISRRIKVLVSELERAQEARRKLAVSSGGVGGGDATKSAAADAANAGDSSATSVLAPGSDTAKRLDSVLPLLSKVEPLLPIVPALLARLQSLSTLHASSASFAQDVESLESVLRASQTHNEELKTMLAKLETSLGDNEKRTKDNLGIVEARMENLVKRIEALRT